MRMAAVARRPTATAGYQSSLSTNIDVAAEFQAAIQANDFVGIITDNKLRFFQKALQCLHKVGT